MFVSVPKYLANAEHTAKGKERVFHQSASSNQLEIVFESLFYLRPGYIEGRCTTNIGPCKEMRSGGLLYSPGIF